MKHCVARSRTKAREVNLKTDKGRGNGGKHQHQHQHQQHQHLYPSGTTSCGRRGSKQVLRAIAKRPEKFDGVEGWKWPVMEPVSTECEHADQEKIGEETLCKLEFDVLDSGEGVKALRRFNDALDRLSANPNWERALEPVWAEMAYNLETFNPVFTACMLKVQCTVGSSDYVARDDCLQNLIQPLAGEYGLHEGDRLGKTHRALFSDWYTSVTGNPLSRILKRSGSTGDLKPRAGQLLFAQMMRDVSTGGGAFSQPLEQASYALGYNLAVEYLANPEKTWLLDSFQGLSRDLRLEEQGRKIDWEFLEVHALGEKEHADIGHRAVTIFVPADHAGVVQKALQDHDRDFATYYNELARVLE